MTQQRAVSIGLATFVITFGLCIALFAWLDVQTLYLVGPAVAVAIASYYTYKRALDV